MVSSSEAPQPCDGVRSETVLDDSLAAGFGAQQSALQFPKTLQCLTLFAGRVFLSVRFEHHPVAVCLLPMRFKIAESAENEVAVWASDFSRYQGARLAHCFGVHLLPFCGTWQGSPVARCHDNIVESSVILGHWQSTEIIPVPNELLRLGYIQIRKALELIKAERQ